MSNLPNPSIAILGLEGSGKTVLMTVLAKKLSTSSVDGYYLDPVGIQTLTRVENTWTTLQHGEWPPSTPPGEMFSLTWKLYIQRQNQKIEADIRLIDLAGQDTRQLFNSDDFRNETRPHLKPLVEYISNASILLFVLNIKDYVTETNDKRRIENQAVLKSALDQLSGSKKILLAFTQYDQYEEYITRSGGLDAFCRKHIPYIYHAYLDPDKKVFGAEQIPMLCISAVNDTQTKIGQDGTAQQVPTPEFSSRGLEDLCRKLADSTCAFYAQQEKEKKVKITRRCGIAAGILAVAYLLFSVFMTPHIRYKNSLPKPGERLVKTVDGVEYAFRWCPPGTFKMGSPYGEPGRDSDEGPQHKVKLTKGFWMLETEVTQEMWQSVMGIGIKTQAEKMLNDDTKYTIEGEKTTIRDWYGLGKWEASQAVHGKGPKYPIYYVNWSECKEFCRRLSGKIGMEISLPTEAQWEYACRAGSTTALYTGDICILGERDAPALDDIAWYGGNSSQDFGLSSAWNSKDWKETQYSGGPCGAHPVGKKTPNAWGLYDMIGNVWEWCADWYDDYPSRSVRNPTGPKNGSRRVNRGGDWYSSARHCRSARRCGDSASIRGCSMGFRVVGSNE